MGRVPWNKGITNVKPKPCLCGCGELVKVHKYQSAHKKGYTYLANKYIKGHGKRGVNGFDSAIHLPRSCQCGCGQKTKKFRGKFNRFIKGHENIGRTPWNKGIPFSEKSRKKMSNSHLGKIPANKVALDKKKLHTYYILEKKSAATIARIMNTSYDSVKNRLREFGWARTTKEACSLDEFRNKMRIIRVKELSSNKKLQTPNKLEKMVYTELDTYDVQYEKQAPLFGKFVVDVLFPEEKIILEIFGKYWHTMPQNIKKDKSKKKYLEKCGYEVVELWDYQIYEKGISKAIKDFVKKYNLI